MMSEGYEAVPSSPRKKAQQERRAKEALLRQMFAEPPKRRSRAEAQQARRARERRELRAKEQRVWARVYKAQGWEPEACYA